MVESCTTSWPTNRPAGPAIRWRTPLALLGRHVAGQLGCRSADPGRKCR
jgi:hypothetical protein